MSTQMAANSESRWTARGRAKFFTGPHQAKNVVPEVKVELRTGPDTPALCPDTPSSAHNPENHLVFREPAPATLTITREMGREEKSLLKREVLVPQAGHYVALPLVNKLFRNTSLAAAFSRNGALRSFKFVSKPQTAALAQVAEAVEGALESAKTKELRELQNDTELAKAEAALIRARQDLDALRSSDDGE